MPEEKQAIRVKAQWVSQSTDGVICKGKTLLFSVCLTDDAGGNADITLYDGENASGIKIAKIKTLQHTSFQAKWTPALELDNGLYLDVGSNVDSVVLTFINLSP